MESAQQHNLVSPEAMELGYEPTTAPVRGLLIFLVLVVITAAILHLVIWWMYKGIIKHDTHGDTPGSVIREDQTPPEPNLQPSVGHDAMDYQDLEVLRHREDEMFTKLGWQVHPGAKDADIPVDVVRQVADEQRARAAGTFVPPTTTGGNANSIVPTTIPIIDTHPGVERQQ